MSKLPKGLEQILSDDIYKRQNKNEVGEALERLDVKVSETFKEFYETYIGSFWEETVPFELLDIVDEPNRNIETYTNICRNEHDFPKHYLVLSEMSTGTVIVLDSETDKVYKVNFEGGQELLIRGELNESWLSFYEFLIEYFNC